MSILVYGQDKKEESVENKMKCPWCGEEMSPQKSEHRGPYGKIRLTRCSQCQKLISGRLEGEPDAIIRKRARKEGQ